MTINEAEEIISDYEYWKDKSCTCFQCAPCNKCTDCPCEDDYNEALSVIIDLNDVEKINDY